jgi:tetratricopeptide (TPR) repeat protein
MRFGPWHNSILLAATWISLGALAFAEGIQGTPPDPLSDPGFQHFYNLEYDDAMRIFTARVTANPSDPAAHTALAETVLFYAMFRNRALDSDLISATNPFVSRPRLKVTSENERQFQSSINKAMEICQKRIDANPRDETAVYTLGVAYGLRANWSFLVTKEYISALRDATQARKLHNQASEIDPKFLDARFVQAAHDYVLGSLPIGFKLLGFLAGFRGDREGGMRTLREVAENGHANRVDAAVLLSAILRREKRPAEAVPLLANVSSQFPRNYLFRFELARMYADSGDKTNAIANLDSIEQMRAKGTPGFQRLAEEKIAFDKGNVYFWYGDLDLALDQLKRATSPDGPSWSQDDAAMAWLRVGQTLDLQGHHKEAKSAYQTVVRMSPQSEISKEARDFMLFPYKRKRA